MDRLEEPPPYMGFYRRCIWRYDRGGSSHAWPLEYQHMLSILSRSDEGHNEACSTKSSANHPWQDLRRYVSGRHHTDAATRRFGRCSIVCDSQPQCCLARGESTLYTSTEIDLSDVRVVALACKTRHGGRWLATTVLPVAEFIKHDSESLAMNALYAESGSYLACAYYKNGKAYLKHESMYDVAELWQLM